MIRIGNILGLFGNSVAVLGNPIPIPPPVPEPDASGGSVTYDGDYAIHTFSSSGTFIANKDLSINILVVAGGGAGGECPSDTKYSAGGGGAGGVSYREGYNLSSGSYTVTVGDGGQTNHSNGENSSFGALFIAYGGGGGGYTGGGSPGVFAGAKGGSGGGGAGNADTEFSSTYGDSSAGTATHYGNRGGSGSYFGSSGYGGGGGGAGGFGGSYGNPGSGISLNISGTSKTYACGGPAYGDAELPNVAGNGGKAEYAYQNWGKGKTGIVIIRYKYK